MKVTKIQFNSFIQSSTSKPQNRKQKNIGSKRLIYQFKKNAKMANTPLELINKTVVVSKPMSRDNSKIKQFSQDYDISLQSNLLNPIIKRNSQLVKYEQRCSNPQANSQLQSVDYTLEKEQKSVGKFQHRKNKSHSSQSRYDNSFNINPYTKQQYLHVRKSKQSVSSQSKMKIKKIRQITKPCFISGIELVQRVPMPKMQMHHISRPRSSNQYRKTKIIDTSKQYRTIKKEDYLQPWRANENEFQQSYQ